MPELSTHPSPEELSAYSLGQLPEERAVAIDTHISECEPCCETIVQLSSEDTFAGLLQEAGQLAADQTVDHDSLATNPSSSSRDIPAPLAEHPRYEIVRLIGKGGMGDVYEAQHRKMERTVAVKVINRELVRKPEAVERFHREVKTAAQLSHPNIVTAHDADQAGDYHFMVMEYVDGIDLSQIVKGRGALPVAEACGYIRQAAIGLQHAHEQGMVHRDIKPHNLMVTADGTVKILDFGLASLAPEPDSDNDTVEAHGELTAGGAIMGTPDFISPEQANDARKADIRSDIYSLGATFYFLLSGRPLFADGSVMHKLKSHAQVEPEPLQSIRDDIPADLAAVVARMTSKNPDDRYQSPLEVEEALESITRATPSAITAAPDQTLPGGIRGRAMTLLAVVTLFLASVASAVVYYIQTNEGVIRVRVTDASLAVTIKGQTVKMNDGDKQLTIRAGHHKLEVRHDDSDFKFATDQFEMERNGEIAFEVDLIPGKVVVTQDGVSPKMFLLPESARPTETDSSPDNAVATEPRFELHFVEPRPIEGVTEQTGIKYGKGGVKFGTGPDQLVYLHVKPALVLNPSQVTSIKMQPWSFAGNQLYSIHIELTDPARKKLAAVVEGKGNHMRHVTYKVDGVRRGGWQRYEINENHGGAPEICRAKTFSPLFDASKDKELALRIVNALTPEKSTSSAPAPTTSVVRQLLKDDATRAEGNKLLKRLWLTDRDSHYNLLTGKRDEVWSHVADPIFYLRSKLIPADIAREASGWGRFTIEGVYEGSEEPGWGIPLSLRPLVKDKDVVWKLIREVETAIKQHPHWKAGVAVLSYLEAETGNYERATDLIAQVLADSETRPIPSDSAFVFGMALEGKNAELDRQVMRLYESSLRNRPARVFRASAIPKLARLHAKYGERPEARRVLNRLTDVDYDPSGSHVICTPGGHSRNHSRCTECHRGKSNLLDVVVMSNNLTDVEYPVDALISLARINASFSNAYGSDDAWAKKVFPDNPYLNIARGQSRFVPAKEKAEKAITPQAVLEALKSGVFSGSDMTKPAPADADSGIDLMLSVRGEGGQAAVFSPVIDVLTLAVESQETGTANDIAEVDKRLVTLSEKHPKSIEAGIAATVFAFLRNDLDSAKDRLKQLQEITDYPASDGVAFWLAANHALQHDQTKIIGAVLAERALTAAETQPDSALKEAILRERAGIRTK